MSPNLLASLAPLVKIAISPKENNNQLKIEPIYIILSKISEEVAKDAEKSIEQDNFDEVAYIFLLISEVLRGISSVIANTDASDLLKKESEQWLYRADSMIGKVAKIYSDQALISDLNAEFSKASEYRNKADSLSFDIRRQVADDIIEIFYTIGKRTIEDALPGARQTRILGQRNDKILHAVKEKPEEGQKRTIEGLYRPLISGVAPSPYSQKQKVDIASFIVSHSTQAIRNNNSLIISPEDIKLMNSSTPIPSKKGWYNWSVSLYASDDILSRIRGVTYTLHPTFPDPIREVKDPTTRFELRSEGWAEFEIKADVHLDNGDTITKYHWLNLRHELK
ncbi:MAG: hypothetical protein M3247_04055 [Thermoproteota archaeon]|nr:hypothetical protein [Thermoproteota archaeon]